MAKLTKADLIGVWLLDEFIVHRESGERFVWPGRQSGTLIYTDDGYVSDRLAKSKSVQDRRKPRTLSQAMATALGDEAGIDQGRHPAHAALEAVLDRGQGREGDEGVLVALLREADHPPAQFRVQDLIQRQGGGAQAA